jgi:Sigma-70, region 4
VDSGLARTLLSHAGPVYSAAAAACRDPSLAEAVAERVLTSAAGAGEACCDRRRLVEQAVVLGVRVDPAPPFDGLPPDEREAVALARLAGCTVGEIAIVLESSAEGVKGAMLRALERLATTEPALV